MNPTLAMFLLILSAGLCKAQSPANLVTKEMVAWDLDPDRLAEAGVREVTIRKYAGEKPDTGFVHRRFVLNESGQPTDYFAILADGSIFEHCHNEWEGEVLTRVVESKPPNKYRITNLYYSQGQLDSTVDTQNERREFLYDQRDSLIGVLAGIGSRYNRWKIRRTYDEQGRRISDSLVQSSHCKIVNRYAYDAHDRLTFQTMLVYRNTVEDWTEKRFSYDDNGLLLSQNIQVKDRIPYDRKYQYDDQGRMVLEETYGSGQQRPQKYTRWTYSADGRRVETSHYSLRKKKPGETRIETFREDGLPDNHTTKVGKKYWIISTYQYGFAE